MPVDLFAELSAQIAVPLEAALAEAGAPESVELAPPTRTERSGSSLSSLRSRLPKQVPQAIADDLAQALDGHPLVAEVEATAGFLNLRFNWQEVAAQTLSWAERRRRVRPFGMPFGQRIVIEYSSPNTNKPLHLGHCRNNVLGAIMSAILAAACRR